MNTTCRSVGAFAALVCFLACDATAPPRERLHSDARPNTPVERDDADAGGGSCGPDDGDPCTVEVCDTNSPGAVLHVASPWSGCNGARDAITNDSCSNKVIDNNRAAVQQCADRLRSDVEASADTNELDAIWGRHILCLKAAVDCPDGAVNGLPAYLLYEANSGVCDVDTYNKCVRKAALVFTAAGIACTFLADLTLVGLCELTAITAYIAALESCKIDSSCEPNQTCCNAKCTTVVGAGRCAQAPAAPAFVTTRARTLTIAAGAAGYALVPVATVHASTRPRIQTTVANAAGNVLLVRTKSVARARPHRKSRLCHPHRQTAPFLRTRCSNRALAPASAI
jgi:hypothetical protein